MMEPEWPTENSGVSTDEYARNAETWRGKSLLVQWALYFSRFDPLVALASDFEKER
jgi:hypothetical protein